MTAEELAWVEKELTETMAVADKLSAEAQTALKVVIAPAPVT